MEAKTQPAGVISNSNSELAMFPIWFGIIPIEIIESKYEIIV
jgi:hypothetical protein